MRTALRSANVEDKEAIFALMVRVIEAAIEKPHQEATVKNVSANLEIWAQRPETCVHLVAVRDSDIVGVVLVKEFWNLCSLFVRAREQGSGIGKQLTLAALDACRGRSPINAVYLNAAPNAIQFYVRLGFMPRESRQSLPPGYLPMGIALSPSEA